MNFKGHLGFGSISLIPIIAGKQLPYITTNEDNIIIQYINEIINKVNFNLINFHLNFNIEHFFISIFIFLAFLIGIKFPDWDTYIMRMIYPSLEEDKRYLYHRQLTHSFLLVILGLIFSKNIFLFAFFYGMFTHIVADMLTGSVPLFFIGKYYKSNIFTSRIGIDMFYIYGLKSLKKTINKIKKTIVYIFDFIGYYLYIFTTLIYFFPSILDFF